MITIVDYGMGNPGSLLNMFKHIGVDAFIEADPEAIKRAEKVLLPGVGAFDAAMNCINSVPGLRDILDHKALVECVPVLGICLGMQLMTRASEEGKIPGLGWMPAKTLRLPNQLGLKVPHMGWNVATPNNLSKLTLKVGNNPRYYFVHSFCVHLDDPAHSIMRSQYGVGFDSAFGFNNIYGVQFHPEKSHRFGMQILKNFAEL